MNLEFSWVKYWQMAFVSLNSSKFSPANILRYTVYTYSIIANTCDSINRCTYYWYVPFKYPHYYWQCPFFGFPKFMFSSLLFILYLRTLLVATTVLTTVTKQSHDALTLGSWRSIIECKICIHPGMVFSLSSVNGKWYCISYNSNIAYHSNCNTSIRA